MAGLDEVSKLLGELAKASGDANSKAMALQAKEKVENAKSAIGGSGTSQKQTPAERYDNLQVAKEVANLADELGLSSGQKADLTRDIIGGGGGFLSNVRQMVEQGFLGSAPKGGSGSAAGGKAAEAGVELVVETAKGVVTSVLATPDVEFAGFNSGTALLSDVPDSTKYVDGLLRGGFVEFIFMDLGGTPLQDGIGGRVRIDWANCSLANVNGLNFPQKSLMQ